MEFRRQLGRMVEVVVVEVLVLQVIVEKDIQPEVKCLHPSLLVPNCFEFAMWTTFTAFAKESPCSQYVVEEAVVKLLPV